MIENGAVLLIGVKFGIIHASDSNLTTGGGNRAGESKKTFPVSYLTAGLTVAGAFSVGGMPMAKWMDKFIAAMDPQGGNLTLRAFSEILEVADIVPPFLWKSIVLGLDGQRLSKQLLTSSTMGS